MAEAGDNGRHVRRRQPEYVAAKGHRPHQRGPESHYRHQQCAQGGEGRATIPAGTVKARTRSKKPDRVRGAPGANAGKNPRSQ